MRTTSHAARLLVAAALASGCLGPMTDQAPVDGGAPVVSAWVVDHGWHTAIVVRRSDVDRAVWPEVNELAPAAFVEVAWGDRDFYMAREPSGWLAVKAALFTGGSVLHVAAVDDPGTLASAGVDAVQLGISRRGFDAMTRFVRDEYGRDDEGRPVRLGPGLYGVSSFYAARSRYHLFNTCNTWVARALRVAGLDVTPAGTITAGGVMGEARRAATPRRP